MERSTTANVASWLRERAALHPERLAIGLPGGAKALRYGELEALTDRVAHGLREAGIGSGDRLAVALGSEPLYLGLFFAAAGLGAILLPLNTRLAVPELAFQLDDAEPALLIADTGRELPERRGTRSWSREDLLAALPDRAEALPLAPGGEAPQVILYTSGTTGRPKGAVLPHRKTVSNTENAERYFGLSESDVVVVPVPLFHSYGLLILSVPALFAGARIVLVPRFDPRELQACVAREHATVLGAVPVMYRRMLDAGLDAGALGSLRVAWSAGAALDVDTIRAYHRAGVRLRQGYGQTETSILCCLDAAHSLSKAGSVGRPVGHCQLRIADTEGRSLPRGAEGEVQVRGGVVMLGYWRRPAETESARCDGWHRTGDLGVQDEEGFVTLVGRLGEMYISGGENVYPAEVERVLEQHPEVAEAAVVGVPDPEWGQVGHAWVVPRGAALDCDALLEWTRDRLAGYKRPRRISLAPALPRTPSGKVQKHLLERG